MPDYKTLYFKLFAAIADAVEDLDARNYGTARTRLVSIQQEAEELYLESDERENIG